MSSAELETSTRTVIAASGRGWELVIPQQDVVVRLNARSPDASPLDFLPAVRPYGVRPMARVLRREIPGLVRAEARRIAARAHRGERAVAATGERESLVQIQTRLRMFHTLVSVVEPS